MHDHVTEDANGRNVSVQLLATGPDNSANNMAKKLPVHQSASPSPIHE